MNAAYVDTGIWYAFANERDALHARARDLIENADQKLVAIWPVIWETITLLSRELGGQGAASVGKELIAEGRAKILELTPADHVRALDFLARFDRLHLSAADASGCAIVRRLNISVVMSFDLYFQIVLPDRTIRGLND